MKEMMKRVKVGWVYLFGIALIAGFSLLAMNESEIKPVKAKNESTEVEKDSQAKEETSTSTSTTLKKEQPKAEPKKENKQETAQNTNNENITVTTSESSSPQAPASTVSPSVTTPKAPEKTVTMTIAGLGTYNIPINDGDNAFNVLRLAANQNNFALEYKIYSWGVMITKIGGTKAEGTNYWALYYNGGYSSVGASDLIVKNKDIIEWRYESWM